MYGHQVLEPPGFATMFPFTLTSTPANSNTFISDSASVTLVTLTSASASVSSLCYLFILNGDRHADHAYHNHLCPSICNFLWLFSHFVILAVVAADINITIFCWMSQLEIVVLN